MAEFEGFGNALGSCARKIATTRDRKIQETVIVRLSLRSLANAIFADVFAGSQRS